MAIGVESVVLPGGGIAIGVVLVSVVEGGGIAIGVVLVSIV
jgi:hypothetical protein